MQFHDVKQLKHVTFCPFLYTCDKAEKTISFFCWMFLPAFSVEALTEARSQELTAADQRLQQALEAEQQAAMVCFLEGVGFQKRCIHGIHIQFSWLSKSFFLLFVGDDHFFIRVKTATKDLSKTDQSLFGKLALGSYCVFSLALSQVLQLAQHACLSLHHTYHA